MILKKKRTQHSNTFLHLPARVFSRQGVGVTIRYHLLLLTTFMCTISIVHGQNTYLDDLREQAVRKALVTVGPSVVRIETAGGLERVDRVLRGTGPTTGVVVDANGWIISSAYNLANRPAGVLVTLPNGARFAARVVGTDHNRMVSLLKIEHTGLVVPNVLPVREMRTGQTALALGRTWSLEEPSVSVGIVSALGRVWGRAIQTDAKVSPVNYGGPLVDLQGRVFGVLVPLSNTQQNSSAGVEYYDSGIGFAIPLEDILRSLPRLRQGDLHSGLLGIYPTSNDMFSTVVTIGKVAWRSPAENAGLRPGDVVIGADGKPVRRLAEFFHAMGTKYVGETLELQVRREKENLTVKMQLVAKMPQYTWPFVGVVLAHDGLTVRHVLEGTPARHAGLQVADKLLEVAGTTVQGRADLTRLLDRRAPGETLPLLVQRGDKKVTLEVVVGVFPGQVDKNVDLVGKSPPLENSSVSPKKSATGLVQRSLGLLRKGYWAYVPENYHPENPLGVVLGFLGKDALARDKLVQLWKETCSRHGLALVVVPPASENWTPSDLPRVVAAVTDFRKAYTIDPARVIVHAHGAAAGPAMVFVQGQRSLVRGLALVQARPPAMPAMEPSDKLAFWLSFAPRDPALSGMPQAIEALRKQQYSVTVQTPTPAKSAYLDAEALDSLGRWSLLLVVW